MLGSCFVSSHFLWAILCPQAVDSVHSIGIVLPSLQKERARHESALDETFHFGRVDRAEPLLQRIELESESERVGERHVLSSGPAVK